MSMHAVLIRAAVLLVTCLGLVIALPGHQPAQGSLVPAPAIAARMATALLPITVLPTITVRPSAAEIAAAMNADTNSFDDAPKFIKATRQQPLLDTTASLRGLRLDMPYYSFGKILTRVSKE